MIRGNKSSGIFCVFLLMILFVTVPIPLRSQESSEIDSLVSLYNSGKYDIENRLELLWQLVNMHPEPSEMLFYSEELIASAEALGNTEYMVKGHTGKGSALRTLGEIEEALESLISGLEIAFRNDMVLSEAKIFINIGDCFSAIDDHIVSVDYYKKGIKIFRERQEERLLANSLFNLGDEYYKRQRLDTALLLYLESKQMFKSMGDDYSGAYNIGNIGRIFVKLGLLDSAETLLVQSINILGEYGDLYPVSAYSLARSEIYRNRGDPEKATEYARYSLSIADSLGLKVEARNANLQLHELYEEQGLVDMALKHYKDYVSNNDSLKAIEASQVLNRYEISQKQSEVDLLVKEAEISDLKNKRQKWVIYGTGLSLAMVALVAVSAFRRYRYVKRTNKIIETEKNRSEDLLLNILPEETADELKEKGSVQARKIEKATVLFTDFIDFTKYSEKVAPEQMVKSIDFYFKRFDEIITKYKLEKIKTIGDSYMCAGGLHSDSSQAKEVVLAALEMLKIKDEAGHLREILQFDMRIGIHCGSVVAGIVGTKKWQYDIWGDTVNIASGMEANSIAGRINISENILTEIQDDFQVESRGSMEIKNRNEHLKMYFIKV